MLNAVLVRGLCVFDACVVSLMCQCVLQCLRQQIPYNIWNTELDGEQLFKYVYKSKNKNQMRFDALHMQKPMCKNKLLQICWA